MILKLRKKNLEILFALLFGLSLASCGAVTIEDHSWYGDMGPEGAYMFHTLSDEEGYLDKETWDALRFGMVCTNSDSFANLKAAILKLCHKNRRCVFEAKEKIETFFKRVEDFNATRLSI